MPSLHDELRTRADQLHWYHTLDLPGGVVTRGYYDLRGLPGQLPLPPSLAGKRCLDVATANGFWAFELERRGAGEVVGLDVDPSQLDWPGIPPDAIHEQYSTAEAFRLAHEALGSAVERKEISVYDVAPDKIGEFDLVFIGNVLLHLRDPVGALIALRSVVRGQLLSLDVVSQTLSLISRRRPLGSMSRRNEPRWWTPNRAAHRSWVETAGFDVIGSGAVRQPFGKLIPRAPQRLAPGELAFAVTHRQFGVPSQWLLARPPSGGSQSRGASDG